MYEYMYVWYACHFDNIKNSISETLKKATFVPVYINETMVAAVRMKYHWGKNACRMSLNYGLCTVVTFRAPYHEQAD